MYFQQNVSYNYTELDIKTAGHPEVIISVYDKALVTTTDNTTLTQTIPQHDLQLILWLFLNKQTLEGTNLL